VEPSRGATPQRVRPVRPAGGPRAILGCEFSEDGRSIILATNVRSGWRQLKRVWGFCEEVRLSSLRHRDLRVQVKVLPRWGVVSEMLPVFSDRHGLVETVRFVGRRIRIDEAEPSGQVGDTAPRYVREVTPRPVLWSIHNGDRLEATVNLLTEDGKFSPTMRWKLSASGAPTAHFVDHLTGTPADICDRDDAALLIQSSSAVEYQLQILFVARPSDLRRGPVERAWLQRHFVSGGLPELGKRR
jgi:hypothetical protein